MKYSIDPAHDLGHVKRVVKNVKNLSKELNLNEKQKQAIILAAWWHDVSRTTTKRPSFIVMPFIDDLLSALLLWRETIRCKFFGSVAGMSTRIIFCKSMGTGKFLTKILLSKKSQVLLHVLQDADTLDLLNTKRMEQIMNITENGSRLYHYGYKTMIWWFLHGKQLYMKTKEARKYVAKLISEFLHWIKQQHIYNWHIKQFGKKWFNRNIKQGEKLIIKLQKLGT